MPNGASPKIDFYAAYPDVNGYYQEIYYRYEGKPGTPQQITKDGLTLGYKDAHPIDMIHYEGTSYVFVGDFGVPNRQYALNPISTGMLEARVLGGKDSMFLDAIMRPDGLNIAAANVGDTAEIMIEQLDANQISTFVLEDLDITASYKSIGDLPVGGGHQDWTDDVFIFVGPTLNNPTDLSFGFYDSLGQAHGIEVVPLNFEDNGEKRVDIARVTAVSRGSFFTIGGDLHVVWIENRYKDDPNNSYQVMYYDQVSCYVSQD